MRGNSAALLLVLLATMFCVGTALRPAFASTPSTTTIHCTSPVTVGSISTCTITITPPSATGTVGTFTTSGTGSFAPTTCTLLGGSCSVTYTPTSTIGSPNTITAKYSGNGTYSNSTSSGGGDGSVTVNPVQSSVALGCSPSTVTVGSSSACTATVTGYSPTGLVSFLNTGGTARVAVPPSCTLSAFSQSTSSCLVIVTTAGVGSVTIQASYPGDSNNIAPANPSQTTLSVSRSTSTTSVVCAPAIVIAGQQTSCTAKVGGDAPTGSVTWSSSDPAGVFSANPCTLLSASCGVSYTPTTSATITATYQGDANNTGSVGTFSITANVQETIQITVSNSGPATDVTLSGCSVSPNTITADGTPHDFTASSACTGIVVTLRPGGANTRYLTASAQSSLTIPSCSSNSCQAFSATIYYQLHNTYQVTPASPSSWSTAGTINASGTALGVASKPLCTITVSTGAGEFSCQAWSDYSTQVTLGALQVSQNQRWATGESSFTDTSGGIQHISSYYSQVLEDFQYLLIGSTTAPTAPVLSYTGFGANSTFPLTGSESLVWLDSGSSWSVPAVLSGSSSTERWDGLVTSGAATAGQSVALTYYHQFLVTFAYSVVGGGTASVPPSVQFTSFGAPLQGSQGWLDAGTPYNFTNPLGGSTASERWFTPTPSAVTSGAGMVSEVYYHQYAFALDFTVSGGGTYDNPRLSFTSLGSPAVAQVNATTQTAWIDFGAKWNMSALLPNSSPTERWVTNQVSSGTALAPVTGEFLYYHQFLGTLSYSIRGAGGSPPVPSLNYSSLGTPTLVSLNRTANAYWIDSGSFWGVPIALPGHQGERWLSNVTAPVITYAPFSQDAQYAHQFYVEVGVNTPAGGHVANIDQWEDQNASVVLNATPALKWSFAYWQGATAFSYNGTTRLPALTVSGPANETAIFFPGLTIFADSQGSVAYSYGTINGTVPSGSNATVYPPPGRNVTLLAIPNTVEVKFDGWTGEVVGTQLPSVLAYNLQTSVSINSPSVVHATFATDYNDIRTFVIASLVVFIAAGFVFVVRRGYTPKLKQ